MDGLSGREGQCLFPGLSQNAAQSVELPVQPRGQVLRAAGEPRGKGRQHGQGKEPGNAVLDEGRVKNLAYVMLVP